MDNWWILLGVLPGLALLAFINARDAKRPEPTRSLAFALLVGVSLAALLLLTWRLVPSLVPTLSTLETFTQRLRVAFLDAALLEELLKLGGVWLVTRLRSFDERLDGLIYGAFVGVGFGMVENLVHLHHAATIDGLFWPTFTLRSLLSLPLHATLAAWIGLALARRRFDHQGPGPWGALLATTAVHGVFNLVVLHAPKLDALAVGGFLETPARFLPPTLVLCALILSATLVATRSAADAASQADDVALLRTGQVTPRADTTDQTDDAAPPRTQQTPRPPSPAPRA